MYPEHMCSPLYHVVYGSESHIALIDSLCYLNCVFLFVQKLPLPSIGQNYPCPLRAEQPKETGRRVFRRLGTPVINYS